MFDSHNEQSTAMSRKRSIFQEHLQEETLLSTHQADPTPPQSTAASISSQGESASRRGCGLRFASRFMAKQRKRLDECMHSKIQKQQEAHHEGSFKVLSGRKLKSPFSHPEIGSPSTMVTEPARQQPRFPEPVASVKLPGPLLMQHPEGADSGVQLPQAIPALPSFSDEEPSLPGRGGNNRKRSNPRDSFCSYSGEVPVQYGAQRSIIVQRTASIQSQAAVMYLAEEYDASGGIDSALGSVENSQMELDDCTERTPAPEAWWTAFFDGVGAPRTEDLTAFQQPCKAASSDFTSFMSQRTASNGIESTTAFNQPFRFPSNDFSRWSIPAQRFAQDPSSVVMNDIHGMMVPYSSFEASPDVYSVVSDDADVSFLDLNEAGPAAPLPQPVCSAGIDEQVLPRTYAGFVDDDPYFPYEGMQFILPRKRPIKVLEEVWWVD